MTSISPSITGTCLCTSISYTLTSPSLLSELCHCNNCKTASGSAFMMFDFCNKADFTLTHGSEHIKTYRDNEIASGGYLDRHFCGNCGSPVYMTSAKFADKVLIAAGTRAKGELEAWRPVSECFCVARAAWLPDLGEGVRRLQTM